MSNTTLIPAREIALTSQSGVTLATAGKYCPDHLRVVPRLCPLTVTENGTYPLPEGYAGWGTVTVAVGAPIPDSSAPSACSHPGMTSTPLRTATCAAPGEEELTCPACGHTEVRTVPATAHDDLVTATPATCERGGYTTHTCRTCGRSYVDGTTAPLGHLWGAPDYDDSVSTGQSVTCERCGVTEEYSS